MLTLRSFLERFRPAGTPGAAARRGVPADRVADLTAELQPLLVLLDDVESAAATIRQDAAADAARRHTEAAQEAAAIVMQARAGADAAQAEAFARIRCAEQSETEAAIAESSQRVDTLRTRVDARMPVYVDRVVAEVEALIGQPKEASQKPSAGS